LHGPDAGRDGGERAVLREEAWVSNSGETTISVIDHETRAVATIQLGVPGDGGALHGIAHGIAVARSGEIAYAGTEDSGEVIAIDTRSRAILWRLHAGKNFQLGTLSVDDRRLFVPDLSAGKVVVVDTSKGAVEREIPMVNGDAEAPLSGLHNMYTSYDGTAVFVTAIFSQKVARIDPNTLEVDRLYTIDGQPRPAALTRDLSTMYLQLSSLNGFIALDLATGAETRRIAIPDDGTRPPGWDNWTFAHGIYLTHDERELWVDSVVAGKVFVYSVPALEQLATLDVGIMPRWFAASRDESTLYVTNTTPASDHGTVSVIDRLQRRVVATLDVGKAPKDVHMVAVPR
jgi:DNA-binding beta-propeller fold protein YncE